MTPARSTTTRVASALCTTVLGLAATTAQAAFQDPSNAPWGEWSRSDPGVAYAGWNFFADETPIEVDAVIVDSSPDVAGNTLIGGGSGSGSAATSLGFASTKSTETTGGAFITGGGNIYSPSVATAFDLDLALASAATAPLRVALQTRTLGSELDYAGMRLNGLAADSTTELERIALGGFGGSQVDTLFVWTLQAGVSALEFAFAAVESSVSFDALTVDVAPVPIPAAVWMFASALVPAVRFARRGKRV